MSRTSRHAARLLNTIDTEGAIADVAFDLVRTDAGRASNAGSIAMIEQWVLAQARTRYGYEFNFRRPPKSAVRDARDLAAMLYLLTEKQRRPVGEQKSDPEQLKQFLGTLEPDLVDRLLAEFRRREEQHTEFARDIGRARAWVTASTRSVERALQEAAGPTETGPSECDDERPGIVFRSDDGVGVAVGIFGVVVGLISLWVIAGGPAKLEDWSEGGDDDDGDD